MWSVAVCKNDCWIRYWMAGIAGNSIHLGSNSSWSGSGFRHKRRTGNEKTGVDRCDNKIPTFLCSLVEKDS